MLLTCRERRKKTEFPPLTQKQKKMMMALPRTNPPSNSVPGSSWQAPCPAPRKPHRGDLAGSSWGRAVDGAPPHAQNVITGRWLVTLVQRWRWSTMTCESARTRITPSWHSRHNSERGERAGTRMRRRRWCTDDDERVVVGFYHTRKYARDKKKRVAQSRLFRAVLLGVCLPPRPRRRKRRYKRRRAVVFRGPPRGVSSSSSAAS